MAGLTPVAMIKTSVGTYLPYKITDLGRLLFLAISLILAEVTKLTPFFSLNDCKAFPTLSPKIFFNGL